MRVEVKERKDGRASLQGVVELLAKEKYLSLMIEAGSKVNWSALESGVADKIFFYYAPKILGGMQSLPVAGGAGRRRRNEAIRVHNVRLHSIATDEFAVEAWLEKETECSRESLKSSERCLASSRAPRARGCAFAAPPCFPISPKAPASRSTACA